MVTTTAKANTVCFFIGDLLNGRGSSRRGLLEGRRLFLISASAIGSGDSLKCLKKRAGENDCGFQAAPSAARTGDEEINTINESIQ
jgi:hypothetical protein